jgi:hypothetical protein
LSKDEEEFKNSSFVMATRDPCPCPQKSASILFYRYPKGKNAASVENSMRILTLLKTL